MRRARGRGGRADRPVDISSAELVAVARELIGTSTRMRLLAEAMLQHAASVERAGEHEDGQRKGGRTRSEEEPPSAGRESRRRFSVARSDVLPIVLGLLIGVLAIGITVYIFTR